MVPGGGRRGRGPPGILGQPGQLADLAADLAPVSRRSLAICWRGPALVSSPLEALGRDSAALAATGPLPHHSVCRSGSSRGPFSIIFGTWSPAQA